MGRPSLIQIEVDKVNAKVTAVRVGGTAVRMMEGTLLSIP
jgi:predicted PhzF superfamily epimerase YddE/YHI9